MIETSIEKALEHSKKKKKLKEVPTSPVEKISVMKKLFKKDKNIQDVIEFYEMLKKVEGLRRERIGEFRKNVNLKISYKGEEINMDLENLRTNADMLEKFISTIKQLLLT